MNTSTQTQSDQNGYRSMPSIKSYQCLCTKCTSPKSKKQPELLFAVPTSNFSATNEVNVSSKPEEHRCSCKPSTVQNEPTMSSEVAEKTSAATSLSSLSIKISLSHYQSKNNAGD